MEKFKNLKGITLIALVITIIILLILAGVTLSIVFNGGLLEKSQTAVDTYSEEQAREKLQLAILEYKMKLIIGETIELNDHLKSTEGITVDLNTNKINVDGYEFTVNPETWEIEGGNKVGNQTSQDTEEPEQKTKYTVIINKGTGIESVTETQEVEQGQSLEIAATVASGYKFNKWEIKSGTGTIENEASATTKVTPEENITIEATANITEIIANGNNINGTEHGTITGGDYAYNNPVIPAGFKISTEGASWTSTNGTTVDGWNEGLVIQDESGNQFVWVPAQIVGTGIENVVEYKYYYSVNSTGSASLEQSLPEGILDKNNDKDKENDQITTYGGFYIARYEAGIPSTLTNAISTVNSAARSVPGVPVSKKNQIPWNHIKWSQAKANAESMYTLGNTNNKVQSTLITDRMWETTCKWIESSTPSVNVTSDSRAWGNFKNAQVTGITEYSTITNGTASWITVASQNKGTTTSWILKTGHTEYTNRKNIYDLAGNFWEWTNSKYSSSSSNYVSRGGSYNESGITYPAAYRYGSISENPHYLITFRVGLFVQ